MRGLLAMLPTTVVLEIRRLLDEGRWSHRQIARRLAVSRAVVRAIASGQRGLHGREATVVTLPGPRTACLAARCRECGGMVYQPCRLCAVRALRRRGVA